MENKIVEPSQQRAAKVAGFMFLFIVIGSIFYGIFVLSRLTVTENVLATAENIMANKLLFGIGITWELIMSISAVILGLALYIILKPVNKNFALLGLLLKMMEAAMVVVIALISFLASQILTGQAYPTAFEPEQLKAITGLLIINQTNLHAFPMLFLGINFMLFFFLLCRSNYVPKILARFGIFSYLLIFVFALITILAPQHATIILQSIFWGPSIIFELLIGIWLLIKGLKIRH